MKRLAANLLVILLMASAALAQPSTAPFIFEDVGIDQKLDAQVPKELVLRDHTGRDVKLGEYFVSNRADPSFSCSSTTSARCSAGMVLNELLRTMNGLSSSSAGSDYDVLTVSFNPNENTQLAAAKRESYLREYRRSSGEQGWHFFTGGEESIRQLTNSVGFLVCSQLNIDGPLIEWKSS